MSQALSVSLDSFSSADIAIMDVVIGGRPSGWLWEFAGPGHPKAVVQANRTARERLHKEKLMEQAQVNGKKWVSPEQTPDDVRAGNITYVIERLVGWGAIVIDGKDFPFSEENARLLMSDPKRVNVLAQAMDFLAADSSFTKRSEAI